MFSPPIRRTDMPRETVFRYKVSNVFSDESKLTSRMGTLEGIKKLKVATPVGEGIEIDSSQLDPKADGLTRIDFVP